MATTDQCGHIPAIEMLLPSHTHMYAGTSITGEVATMFAADTGSSISLHDLSVPSLSADYDPFIDIRMLHACI